MRTSSTRLRLSAGLALTTLGLFSLGGSALAGEKANAGRSGATADSPSEAKAEQFEADQESYVEGESRHPSGKDRTAEPGGSGTQGKSTSDPDGDTNGGADKPGGEGGLSTADQDGNNGCGNDQDFEDDNNGWCGSKPKPVKASGGSENPPAVKGDKADKSEKDTRCPKGSTMPEGGSDVEHCVEGDAGNDAGDTVTVDTIATEDTVGVDTVATGAVLGTQLQETGAVEAIETRVLGVTIERGAAADTAAAAAPGTSVLGASLNRGAALARTGLGTTALVMLGLSLLVIGLLMTRTRKGEHFA